MKNKTTARNMEKTKDKAGAATVSLGAVDIGSNAVRLLIASRVKTPEGIRLQKSLFLRVPLRLGEDVFLKGKVGEKRRGNLLHVMNAFRHLLRAYEVPIFRVCATAAMREAENSREIVAFIKKEAGMKIEVLDGMDEARIICESHVADSLDPSLRYIYVDVGGGSTELSLLHGKKIQISRSFNIGTLRMLANRVDPLEWQRLDEWLQKLRTDPKPLEIIGSGGNINKLYRMSKIGDGRKLTVSKLRGIYEKTRKLSIGERMERLGMRPDRADVIIPAAELFLRIASVAGVRRLNVPSIGLVDGIVHQLSQS
ncbi:MAG: hypothetical protein LBG65_07980 [Puniceicoccales bacterium]|jgi:exopolyphosphatase/guanosine-5'-triphosphate,3'-diphosphate pyrophosphatase|nr:hypothetical protein [Puniceicoccales bacterium]